MMGDKFFCSTPAEGAGSSQAAAPSPVKVKKEKDNSVANHSHSFKVKTPRGKIHQIFCEEPCTVLEAIKSDQEARKLIQCEDDKVIMQLGKQHMKSIIATHFPCTCVDEDQTLVIYISKTMEENIEVQQDRDVHPKDRYSVFYIDTVGGNKTISKPLFINNTKKKKFKYLCVYGEKEETVEEALRRDGRFIDDLGDFSLTDNDSGEIIACTVKVEKVHQKEFKITLSEGRAPLKSFTGRTRATGRKRKGQNVSPVRPDEPEEPQNQIMKPVMRYEIRAGAAQQVEVRDGKAVRQKKGVKKGISVDTQEIYELLCKQFGDLKKWMEQRFPGNSYQEALNVRKENFGKIQQSFSEVHRIKELFKLGESICILYVKIGLGTVQGTGFVLFDNYVMTNAHLFEKLFDNKNWLKKAEVTAKFNYEYPGHSTNDFKAKGVFVGGNNLDYAILELETPDPGLVPPGLLKHFGPPPTGGEACIIGHPKGEVKKMDPTCIIEKENREAAVNQNLHDCKDMFTLHTINQKIKTDPRADVIMTYKSFMYHGSSGSPVFDADGRVFGLHTGGFFYGSPQAEDSVIAFAGPLLVVFADFVSNLKESGRTDVLGRVWSEVKENQGLEKIIKSVLQIRDEVEGGQE